MVSVDAVNILIGLIVGGLGGALLSAVRIWSTDEPLIPRKFASAVVIGIVTGFLVAAAAASSWKGMADDQLIIQYVLVLGTAMGLASVGPKAVNAAVRGAKANKTPKVDS